MANYIEFNIKLIIIHLIEYIVAHINFYLYN